MSEKRNISTMAVLLAAGQGKRMKSSLPKVLHEVLGKPIVKRVLNALDGICLDHIYIIVGHQADDVRAFLEKEPPATSFSTHLQEPQLGTGHALMQVEPALGEVESTLLVMPADTPLIATETLHSFLDRHRKNKAQLSVLGTKVADPKNYGRLVRDQHGQVVKIVEDKDASDQEREITEVNTGIFCLEWPLCRAGLLSLGNENRQQEYYLTDLLGWAIAQGHSVASEVLLDWREAHGINSRIELAEANRLLNEKVMTTLALQHGVTVIDPQSTWIAPEAVIGQDTIVCPGSFVMGNVEIGSACVIGPHTTLMGPVQIGDRTSVIQSLVSNSRVGADCRVGPFAHLRDGVEIMDHARMGNFVEIKNSTVGAHTNVSHLSYVGDASLGDNVNIGAGTITANYNHITKVKSRTVIGDGASTGSNSVLVAPVVIGQESTVAAGTVVTKDVPEGALAVARVRQENKIAWTAKKLSKNAKEKA